MQWSIDVFVRAGCAPVVVVVPEDLIHQARATLAPNTLTVVAGGSTRQASVAVGLQHVDTDHVLVHDASRPLIRIALVRNVLDALRDADAVIPVMPVDETLKSVTDDGVVATVLRSGLWRAQTPQGFDSEILKRAHEKALDEGFEATDEAGLIERYGGRVVTVPGDLRNVKITYAEDFELAEALLAEDR